MELFDATTPTNNHRRRTRLRSARVLGLGAIYASAFSVMGCTGNAETNRLGEAEGAASNPSPAHTEVMINDVRTNGCEISRVTSDDGHVVLIFNDDEAPEKRLWANAPEKAPTCTIAVPMKIPAGQMLVPATLGIKGYGHKGSLTAYYYWQKGKVTSTPASGDKLSNAYSFNTNLPNPALGADDTARTFGEDAGKNLAGLRSPTCDNTQTAQVVTLVITLQRFVVNPHTHSRDGSKQYSDAYLALDSILANLGATVRCGTPDGQNRIVHHGEECGWVNEAQANCGDRENRCIIPFEKQFYQDNPEDVALSRHPNESGICVDTSTQSKDRPSNLVSGSGGRCGGPFHQRCAGTDEQLICTFKSSHPAESSSDYWGMCQEPKDLGEACHNAWVRGCNDQECNRRPNPCKKDLKCENNICVDAKGVKTRSVDEEGSDTPAYGDDPSSIQPGSYPSATPSNTDPFNVPRSDNSGNNGSAPSGNEKPAAATQPPNTDTSPSDEVGDDRSGSDWAPVSSEEGDDTSTLSANSQPTSSYEQESDTSGGGWDLSSDEE